MSNDISSLSFNVSTLVVKDGKQLKAITPDAKGIYRRMPVMILGKPSRGNSYYEEKSVIKSMTDPSTVFYKKITEGCLEGEYCHPFVASNDDKKDIARLLYIDRNIVSHYFTSFYTEDTPRKDFKIIYADFGICGPRGKDLKDSLEDPNRNTGFSIRTLTTRPQIVNGIMHKKVILFITVDAVDCPGFEEASKRYASCENMIDIPITTKDFLDNNEYKKAVGFESIKSQDLYDMLETDKIYIKNESIGIYSKDNNKIITKDGEVKSVFHSMFRRGN